MCFYSLAMKTYRFQLVKFPLQEQLLSLKSLSNKTGLGCFWLRLLTNCLRYQQFQCTYTVMNAIENLNIPPFTRNFKQNTNAWKVAKPLTFNAHNLKTTWSRYYLKTDLNRAKVGHSSDMIFVSLAKLFNKNSKLWSSITPVCMS